jgi:outer membrane protein TolC
VRYLFFLLFVFSTGIVGATEELSLRKASELLFAQNPKLAQDKNQSEIAHDRWLSARSAYLPQIDFSQTWNRSNNPVYVFGSLLNQQNFGPENFAIASLNDPDPLTDVSSKFFANWLLFDFGRRESQVHSAEHGYFATTYELAASRASLLQELVKRFYGVSLAEQKVTTARDAVKTAEARLEHARNRVEQGMVVKTDLLSAQVYQSRRQQEEIDAVNQHALALASLEELLGSDVNLAAYTFPELRKIDFPDQELDAWISEMQKNRPELKALAEMQQMARSNSRTSRSNFLPTLNAWSGYEWHGESLDYSGNNWGVGFELRWNVFRGYADAIALSSARKELKSAEERTRETNNALKLQVQSAYYQYASTKEKLKVSSEALREADENRRIYSERYNSGLVTILDSLQAETAYNELRLLYTQNLYDLYVNYSSLLTAAGRSGEIPALVEIR